MKSNNQIDTIGKWAVINLFNKDGVLVAESKINKSDVEKCSQYRWCLSGDYCSAKINGKNVRLHRFLLNVVDASVVIDHKNLDKLDNRRSNLRKATQSQNMANRLKPKHNSSGYKGVYWSNTYHKWCSRIQFNNKIFRRYFIDLNDALNHRKEMELLHHKEFRNVG